MFVGNILIFISLATLFGASDGIKKTQAARLVDAVNKHINIYERKRKKGKKEGTGRIKWENIAKAGPKKDEYYIVDEVKGRYAKY